MSNGWWEAGSRKTRVRQESKEPWETDQVLFVVVVVAIAIAIAVAVAVSVAVSVAIAIAIAMELKSDERTGTVL
jgi:hypothetical protein